MEKTISNKVANKRLNHLKETIISLLGRQADYEIEVFKVLTNLKYKEKHDIEIKLNRLMY